MIFDRLAVLANLMALSYFLSLLADLYLEGSQRNADQVYIIAFSILFGIMGMGIGSKDKWRPSYNGTYIVLVTIIIVLMIVTPMRYWVISLAIPPLAFYFFRVKIETRDVSLGDFRDLRKIAARINSSKSMHYIVTRIIVLLYTGAFVLLPVNNNSHTSLKYELFLVPILIHDLVMIVLYFQMECVPEIGEGSAMGYNHKIRS